MSEIIKLYENAEVKKQIPKVCSSNELYCKECEAHIEDAMPYCKNAEYPPFTAEKQLELIKFLLKNYEGVDISKKINRFNFLVDNATFIGCHHNDKSFEESLAGVINKLWTDVSEEEKQQIKEILE